MKKKTGLMGSVITLLTLATIATGATFASLQSTSIALTGNQINTSAGLAISTNGTSFPQTVSGFNFTGVVPGGSAFPAGGNTFYIKNTGYANLAIKAALSVTPTNPNGVNLSKTYLVFTRTDGGAGSPVKISIQDLVSSYVGGGSGAGLGLNTTINTSTTAQFSLQVQMDSDAFSGSNASITGLDLWFIGVGA